MSFSIEWVQGIGRYYEEGKSFDNHDEFFCVLNVMRIGPDTVMISGDLSARKLKRKDIIDLRDELIRQGFTYLHCWRSSSHSLPTKVFKDVKTLRTLNNLYLTELTL